MNITRLLLIKENQTSQVNEFSTFFVSEKMQESGLIEIIPLLCTLTIQGQYPVFLHPESPEGAQLGVAAVADDLMATASFVY